MNDLNKENEKNEEDDKYQESKKLQSEQLEAKQLMIAKLLSFMPALHKLPPKLFSCHSAHNLEIKCRVFIEQHVHSLIT